MACNYFYSQFALGVNSKQTCSVIFSSLLSKQDKYYIDAICTCNDIVELCDVLNRYIDLFNNGTEYSIKEI